MAVLLVSINMNGLAEIQHQLDPRVTAVAPATALTSYCAETRVMRLAVHECASAVTDVSSPDCACTAFGLCSSSDSIVAVRRERADYEAGWLSSHSSEVRARVRPRKPVAKERK